MIIEVSRLLNLTDIKFRLEFDEMLTV